MSEAPVNPPVSEAPEAATALTLGLFGKHPAKGDFIASGLAPALQSGLEHWIDATLTACRENLGPGFPALWDRDPAPVLGFWIGEALAGQVVAGLLQPSRDKVGRRYPLILLAAGLPADAPLPPVLAPSDFWSAGLMPPFAAILALRDFASAASLLEPLTAPPAAGLAADPQLVALRLDGDFDRLCRDAALADHRRGAAVSSYWWRQDGSLAALFACQGLPDWRALAWILGQGGAQDAPQVQTTDANNGGPQ